MNTRDKHAAEPQDASEPPISDEVRAEVLRRRAEYARDGKRGRPWEEILADQRRKIAGPR